MAQEFEINNTVINTAHIWTSRLIFNSKLLYNKPLKELTKEELFEVRKYPTHDNINVTNKNKYYD
jgi:hypothetical protein